MPTLRRPPLLSLQGRTIHTEGDNYPSAPPRPGFPQQHAWGAGGGWGPQAPTGEEPPTVPHRTTGPIIDELEDGSHHHVVDFGSSQPDTVEEPEEEEEGGEAWEGPGRAVVKRKRPGRTLAGCVERGARSRGLTMGRCRVHGGAAVAVHAWSSSAAGSRARRKAAAPMAAPHAARLPGCLCRRPRAPPTFPGASTF